MTEDNKRKGDHGMDEIGEGESEKYVEKEAMRRALDKVVQRRMGLVWTGMSEGDDAAYEALYFMPTSFLTRYIELYHRALRMQRGISVGDTSDGAVVRESRHRSKGALNAGIPHAKPVKGEGPGWLVRDEAALEKKQWIDRQLQALGSEIGDWVKEKRLRQGEGRTLRYFCHGSDCTRWVFANWNFCPECGTNQREVRRPVEETKWEW